MKKQTTIMIVIIALLIVSLGGAGALVILSGADFSSAAKTNQSKDVIRTFADWTDAEVFQDVPAMEVEGTKIEEAKDYGSEVYVISVNGTELEHYQDYLKLLEEAGFSKHVDNGENGIDNAVYSSTYTKDELVVTVAQLVNINVTYISASEKMSLSEHLFYDDSYVADNQEGAKTKLAMLELYDYGNGFVFQLKNGHFIVFDGGMAEDGPNLLDYLESQVPEGEIPVVEAWFFSHGHADHAKVLEYFQNNTEDAKRIYVEEIYYSRPSAETSNYLESGVIKVENTIEFVTYTFFTSDGGRPKIYRPQMGQRYYFNDLTIDVIFAQEQIIVENYEDGYNDSSTWLMVELEGQKLLFGADGGKGEMKRVMSIYSQQYMEVDIFQALHHSNNTWNAFTDYSRCKTVLVPRRDMKDLAANKYLIAVIDEYYTFGEGTVVLTFPYEVGTAEILPEIWSHN